MLGFLRRFRPQPWVSVPATAIPLRLWGLFAQTIEKGMGKAPGTKKPASHSVHTCMAVGAFVDTK